MAQRTANLMKEREFRHLKREGRGSFPTLDIRSAARSDIYEVFARCLVHATLGLRDGYCMGSVTAVIFCTFGASQEYLKMMIPCRRSALRIYIMW